MAKHDNILRQRARAAKAEYKPPVEAPEAATVESMPEPLNVPEIAAEPPQTTTEAPGAVAVVETPPAPTKTARNRSN